MSGEWEYDPYEYAEELAAGEDLGHSDLAETREDGGRARGHEPSRAARQGRRSRRRGRRPRCVRRLGRLPRAAVQRGRQATASSPARCGCSPSASSSRSRTSRSRPPRTSGFTVKPILADSEKQPQIAITSPDTFDVFGGYNYQSLLVWPSGGLQPVDTQKIPSLELASTSCSRTASSTRRRPSCTYGQGNAPFRTTFVDPDGSTGLPAVRQAGRRATSRSSAGSARTASRSAASRSPARSSARRPTSTPTRWATTPT